MKKGLLFWTAFLPLLVPAKGHRFTAALPPVDSTAYYRVVLPPAVLSRLNADASDLRLFESSGREVPYLFRTGQDSMMTAFHEYEITEKVFLPDSLTRIILLNKNREKISHISLLIRNAEARKPMRLSGSHDGKQWYVVRESGLISSVRNEHDVSELRLLDFPLTDYLYYRIEIDDKNSAPLDILRAGYYTRNLVPVQCEPLATAWSGKDSMRTRTTWLHLTFREATDIDRLSFSIKEPALFLRTANLYNTVTVKGQVQRRLLQHLVLNSNHPLHYAVGIRASELWVEVENGDNNPLDFEAVTACQFSRYCIARLEKGKTYSLALGDSALRAPQYDLAYFESAIPALQSVLVPGEIVQQSGNPATEAREDIFSDKRFIWASLGIVVVLLALATYKMIRELN